VVDRIDITPFLGQLNSLPKDQPAPFKLTVVGDNPKGVWYLNGVLVLYPHDDYDDSVVLGGQVVSHDDEGAKFDSRMNQRYDRTTFYTQGSHHYKIQGTMEFPDGSTTLSVVEGLLKGWNENLLDNSTSRQLTSGSMTSNHTHVVVEDDDTVRVVSHRGNHYPYRVESSYKTDATTFEIRASIELALEAASHGQGWGEGVAWNNRISSNAVYNKTNDGSATNTMRAQANEAYEVVNALQVGQSYYYYYYKLPPTIVPLAKDSS